MMTQTSIEGHDIEDDDTEGDDDALADLKTIDAGQDVDGIGAEHRQESHVNIVEDTKLETVAQYPS